MEVTMHVSLRKSSRRRRSRRKEGDEGPTAPGGGDDTMCARPGRPAHEFKLAGAPFPTKTVPSPASTVALTAMAMMTTFNLDNAIFYTPPRATGLEGTSQQSEWHLHQRQHPSATQQQASPLSEDAERNRPSETTRAGTTTEPILVPSDSESELEDEGDDNLDFDDSRSDATLPSINTLATSVAKSQRLRMISNGK